jgi:fumarate hydratase class I
MLNPSDSVVEWVLKTVPTMGAGWCPPGMLGIGIGGTAEKAMLMAKESLMDPIDIQDLIARGPQTTAEKLRVELYDKVNRLGIGAQGLGGLTTVLDVKVRDPQLRCYPARSCRPRRLWPRLSRSALARRLALAHL